MSVKLYVTALELQMDVISRQVCPERESDDRTRMDEFGAETLTGTKLEDDVAGDEDRGESAADSRSLSVMGQFRSPQLPTSSRNSARVQLPRGDALQSRCLPDDSAEASASRTWIKNGECRRASSQCSFHSCHRARDELPREVPPGFRKRVANVSGKRRDAYRSAKKDHEGSDMIFVAFPSRLSSRRKGPILKPENRAPTRRCNGHEKTNYRRKFFATYI